MSADDAWMRRTTNTKPSPYLLDPFYYRYGAVD